MNTHLTLLPNVSMLWVACARGIRGIGGETARQCPVTRSSFDSNITVELRQNKIIIQPVETYFCMHQVLQYKYRNRCKNVIRLIHAVLYNTH